MQQSQQIYKCVKCGAMQFAEGLDKSGKCLTHKGRIRASKQVIDGIKFDSTGEANHYVYLKTLQDQGIIQNLRCHTAFPLYAFNVLIGYYTDDFDYIQDGVLVVVDWKSEHTRKETAYQLRRKLFYANYKKEIVEEGINIRRSKASGIRKPRKAV